MANSKMETHSGAFECLTLISERKLYYLSNEQIEKNINERGYKNDTSLKNVSYSDLSPRVYEGFFLFALFEYLEAYSCRARLPLFLVRKIAEKVQGIYSFSCSAVNALKRCIFFRRIKNLGRMR